MKSNATLLAAVLTVAFPAWGHAQSRPLDLQRSKLTVLVYKAGLFSAFADDQDPARTRRDLRRRCATEAGAGAAARTARPDGTTAATAASAR